MGRLIRLSFFAVLQVVLALLWVFPLCVRAQQKEEQGSSADVKAIPFGHYIFTLESEVFEPHAQGSLDPDYPIGPDDEIIITVWGQVELTYKLTVDRDGGINIPRAGRLYVNGVALKDLEKRISQRMAQVYSGISEDPAKVTTFVEVSLGKVKSVKVFVTGEVRRPGSFILTANSSVMTALYYAGGPTEKGSMRAIRLFRHDEQVASIDLYEFILEGDQSEDLHIQNGDVILVPPQGKEVVLEGRVHRPHIYELKDGEGLKRLLEIAGGLEADAYTKRVQIERIIEHRDYTVVDVDVGRLLDSDEESPLSDGDRIFVAAMPEVNFKKVVTLTGYAKLPGRYALVPGMRIKDLILSGEGLFPEAYMGRADVRRTKPDMTRELLSFNLGKALADDPVHNLELAPLDEVSVYSIHTFGESKVVTIHGLVRKPGGYELLEGMGLQDLIVLAGGLKDIAYKVEAEVSRSDPESATPERPIEVFRVKISDVYEINAKQTDAFPLQHRDVVFIRPNPDFEAIRNVTVEGEVRFPGVYALRSRLMHLTELLQRAGGLTMEAYPEGVKFYRPSIDTIAIDLSAALEQPGGAEDPVLQAGDIIEIPKKPATIEIIGAVYTSKHVLFRSGKSVNYYLKRVGGLTKNARKGDIYVVLANGDAVKPGRFLFWKTWPRLNPGSRIVVPFKTNRMKDVAEDGERQGVEDKK